MELDGAFGVIFRSLDYWLTAPNLYPQELTLRRSVALSSSQPQFRVTSDMRSRLGKTGAFGSILARPERTQIEARDPITRNAKSSITGSPRRQTKWSHCCLPPSGSSTRLKAPTVGLFHLRPMSTRKGALSISRQCRKYQSLQTQHIQRHLHELSPLSRTNLAPVADATFSALHNQHITAAMQAPLHALCLTFLVSIPPFPKSMPLIQNEEDLMCAASES